MTEPTRAPEESRGDIDALLSEDRVFPPSAAFREQANVRDASVYERAEQDPEAFWASFAEELAWSRHWDTVLEWNPPHAKWFVGGTLNASVNCLDRHVTTARRNKAALIWEGEPGDSRTLTYWELHREVNRFANGLKALGVRRGDRVAIYMPMVPEARRRDARVRPHRRGAQRRLRRLQRRVAARPDQRRAGQGAGHRRRRLPARRRRAPQEDGRRGARRHADHRARRRAEAAAAASTTPVSMGGGAGRLVPRPAAGRRRVVRARGDGRRGHALHPLHVGHHRQAEGHRPHHRRLPHRRLRHDQVGVRSEGGRRVLVHRRHRLGDGTQLRRLRSAGERGDGRDVRGGARLAREGPFLGHHRASRRHDLLYRADRHPCLHALGPGVAEEARHEDAAPARQRGRADQPRGVDLVPRAHRRRALSRSSIPGGRRKRDTS